MSHHGDYTVPEDLPMSTRVGWKNAGLPWCTMLPVFLGPILAYASDISHTYLCVSSYLRLPKRSDKVFMAWHGRYHLVGDPSPEFSANSSINTHRRRCDMASVSGYMISMYTLMFMCICICLIDAYHYYYLDTIHICLTDTKIAVK
jgi:hypothetical protein